MNLARRAVDDLGRGGDERAHRQNGAFADDDAFDNLGARANEAIILDDRRVGLQGFEHPADADAAGEMHVLADLRTGADRHPSIDHRAFIDIGAEIDEGGHEDDARRDIGRAAHNRARHDAQPRRRERGGVPALEF